MGGRELQDVTTKVGEFGGGPSMVVERGRDEGEGRRVVFSIGDASVGVSHGW